VWCLLLACPAPKVPKGSAIAVTQGDPRGVGPELLLRVAADGALRPGDLVFADPSRLAELAARVPASWAAPGWTALQPLLAPGARAGWGQVDALAAGVDAVLAAGGRLALVTAPIDKKDAGAEGLGHPGHTEYLAARAGVVDFAMCMVGPVLRVVLATIHIPLAHVTTTLREADICRATRLVATMLRDDLGIASPRIGVLSVNPHAGERGMLGDDETRVVAPAIATVRGELPFATIEGPLPADGAFPAHAAGRYDALVAMYHDQGLAPFKLLHWRDGVNATLGLPFRRASPDHGTARDIAGTGRADPASMHAAIAYARGGDR
jgi:4-hydroxythreonine-4-phosphate dehydrogenase